MITYNMQMVTDALSEISKKYLMTKNIAIKEIKYISSKELYVIMLSDDSRHNITKELINKYIETLGDKGGLEIAGLLLHSIELEQSVELSGAVNMDEYWDGNLSDIDDYLKKKEEKENKDS
jgi:hypothetical protein